MDFADTTSQQKDIPLSIAHDLREIHFGDWEGRTSEEIEQTDPTAVARFFQDPILHLPPKAEPLADFKQRVVRAWQSLIDNNHGHEHILVISHGGPIRIIIGYILGIPDERLLNLEVPLACLSRIQVYRSEQHPPVYSLQFHGKAL
jgi:broad specificity phosphatase PhoE